MLPAIPAFLQRVGNCVIYTWPACAQTSRSRRHKKKKRRHRKEEPAEKAPAAKDGQVGLPRPALATTICFVTSTNNSGIK